MIEAKKPTKGNDEKMEKVGLDVLVTAMKGGESRVNRLIELVMDNVTPASLGKEMTEELKGLNTLFQALERAVENIGK